jgi:hypothetical protein
MSEAGQTLTTGATSIFDGERPARRDSMSEIDVNPYQLAVAPKREWRYLSVGGMLRLRLITTSPSGNS